MDSWELLYLGKKREIGLSDLEIRNSTLDVEGQS